MVRRNGWSEYHFAMHGNLPQSPWLTVREVIVLTQKPDKKANSATTLANSQLREFQYISQSHQRLFPDYCRLVVEFRGQLRIHPNANDGPLFTRRPLTQTNAHYEKHS